MRPHPFKTEEELERLERLMAEAMTKLKPVSPPPSQLDAALEAQARGEVYAPPGRCKGCGN